ncbi:esterase [Microbacterium sp. HMWF026]|uniref:alpha/beta hydrolase n=1 Tax=Microbacterium sp. HMWF026 TaxID=2056861 RepID=UPI000D3BD8B1|nr:esterase [Microbacterium sp. HMWF026]PTT18590.1 esterase [Microbacterium sp. HMWF026]
MNKFFLSLELIDSPLITVFATLSVIGVLVVLAWAPRHVVRMTCVALAAGAVMYLVARALSAAQVFDGPLPAGAARWSALSVAGIAAGVMGVATAPRVRRIVGAVVIIASVLTGFLGVNSSYGITHTFAAIMGVQALDRAELPDAAQDDSTGVATWKNWTPPADMPSVGTVSALSGDSRIPSGDFQARDASLYLPPAALVKDPPILPLIVFMMGQPGSPDPTSLAKALDDFAQTHDGLAPIAIVADQTASGDWDPSCADSAKYGPVATYLNTLVPEWAASHLNVSTDHRLWVIGGFSNGGSCAAKWAAEYPQVWGHLIDVSGNEYPGSEHPDATIDEVFGGDRAAFDAATPAAIMGRTPSRDYAGHVAIFTWGESDGVFGPGQQRNALAARSAGFTAVTHVVSGAGHDGPALDGALAFAVPQLAPVLGLAPS